jgi:hypothetical protein
MSPFIILKSVGLGFVSMFLMNAMSFFLPTPIRHVAALICLVTVPAFVFKDGWGHADVQMLHPIFKVFVLMLCVAPSSICTAIWFGYGCPNLLPGPGELNELARKDAEDEAIQ